MAKKKMTPETAYKQFLDVIARMDIDKFYRDNGVIVGYTDGNVGVVIIPEPGLDELINKGGKPEFAKLDNAGAEEKIRVIRLSDFGRRLGTSDEYWVDLSENEKFTEGSILEITVDGSEFPIVISRNLLPLKLRKAEYVGVYYRIFDVDELIGLRKDFSGPENHSFRVIRFFKIV
jgi:hypothetical protein